MTDLIDTKKLEDILSAKAEIAETEGVVKVSFPRNDVPVHVDSQVLPPFMGLTTWAAFQKGKKQGIEAMLMGDIVLFEDEVNSVMDAAFSHSLDITALHNHFFFSDPPVYFMHIEGEGELEGMALGVRAMLDAVKDIRSRSPHLAESFGGKELPDKSAIDGKQIEKIIGTAGQAKDGMFKIVIGRETSASCGCIVGKTMGVNTWAAFAGADDNAVVCGDVAMLEGELQPVLRALRKANINIVAIHNHMTNENPRFIFLHYWGRGTATNLAGGVKSALDETREQKHSHHEHCAHA